MKILVTGPNGNLSAHIIKHCSHEVICLGREDWDNLLSILSDGVDVVIHAAYDLKKRVKELPTDVVSSNIIATTRLIEAMHKCRTPQLIYLSSCSVYGEGMKTNEEAVLSPLSIDGYFKALNEKIIASFCSENDIDFKIYRIFNMYGGNDKFSVLYHLKQSIETGVAFRLNNRGISQRDFIHVEDVSRVILKLLEIDYPYQYLNIGTGIATCISTIVDIARDKHPSLKINQIAVPEVEYSRANIEKLSSLLRYDFINLVDFVKQNI